MRALLRKIGRARLIGCALVAAVVLALYFPWHSEPSISTASLPAAPSSAVPDVGTTVNEARREHAQEVLPVGMLERTSEADEDITAAQARAVVGFVRGDGYVCDTVGRMHFDDRQRIYVVVCDSGEHGFYLTELGGKWSVTAVR